MSKNCPEGLKTQFSDIFWTIFAYLVDAFVGQPVQCSPWTFLKHQFPKTPFLTLGRRATEDLEGNPLKNLICDFSALNPHPRFHPLRFPKICPKPRWHTQLIIPNCVKVVLQTQPPCPLVLQGLSAQQKTNNNRHIHPVQEKTELDCCPWVFGPMPQCEAQTSYQGRAEAKRGSALSLPPFSTCAKLDATDVRRNALLAPAFVKSTVNHSSI